MLNVAWCMRKIRAAPPHSSAVNPPATVPVSATPRPNAAASPAITHRTNVLSTKRIHGSASRSFA